MENPIYEIPTQEYNQKLAEALKKIEEIKEPGWVHFVKSSSAKERPINEPEFWYKRTASILKQIYKKEAIGVNRLKIKYGSNKRRGSRPEEFRKGSGKIIRTILQQCDKAGITELIENSPRTKKLGRKLTKKGKNLLEGIK